jgi:hypothetical protein
MDLARGISRLRDLVRIPHGTKALPHGARLRASLASPCARRRLAGVALIAFSVLLGAWAYDGAAMHALSSWQRSHPPTLRIWEYALGSRGLRRPPEKSRALQASRSLPARLEPEGTAWISGDRNWVAVFGPPTADAPFELFCRACEKSVPGWDSPGSGWEGFETVLALLERMPRGPGPVTRRLAVGDGRQILY